MKRYGLQVAVVAVGVLLGWSVAAMRHDGAAAPAANGPAVAQKQAEPDGGNAHFSVASPEGGATITEKTEADAASEYVAQLVPQKQDTPWLNPVLMGVGALFLSAIVIGIAARRFGVQDPGVAALEQDQKDAEFDEKHDEQPLDAPEAGHGHGGHARH